jgi:hypothetical protein
MFDKYLPYVLCAFPIIIILFFNVYFGTKSRLKLFKQINSAYKAGIIVPSTKDSSRKLFLIFALVSTIGITIISLLIIIGLLPFNALILGIFVILILVDIISGMNLLWDIEKSVK